MELSASPRLLTSPTSLMLLRPKLRIRVPHIPPSPFHLHRSLSSVKLNDRMEFNRTLYCASSSQGNGSLVPTSSNASGRLWIQFCRELSEITGARSDFFFFLFEISGPRVGEVKRVTKETNVSVKINLDGSGIADSSTGIPFLDHMLDVSGSLILFSSSEFFFSFEEPASWE